MQEEVEQYICNKMNINKGLQITGNFIAPNLGAQTNLFKSAKGSIAQVIDRCGTEIGHKTPFPLSITYYLLSNM